MASDRRFLPTAALIAGLAITPAAHAAHWHGGYSHHGGGGRAAGAAIVGGLVGLGLGAALASGGAYADRILCAAASSRLLRRLLWLLRAVAPAT